MPSSPSLTLAFLERQPASAARALGDLDAADAAAFLETAPARLAAPVVRTMVPWMAARCVELMSPEPAVGLVRNMAYQDAASVLRLIGEEQLGGILTALPKALAKGFKKSLSYPTGTVGAWTDHSVPSFPAESSVADALKYVKQRRNQVASHILVVDEQGQFAGAVGLGVLLRSVPKTVLAEIMDRKVTPLSSRAMLTSVASGPAWDDYSMLPVVGRRANVLGGLSRKNLRKGLLEHRLAETPATTSTIWAHLFTAYLLTCSGLLRHLFQPRGHWPAAITEENGRVG